mmetsp:Transcript_26049/g.23057  ORF Transcript_26049/g.23057 Transcript_26049/m.23057 type:complete len:102 (-) Transcript_26049:336-641(-)
MNEQLPEIIKKNPDQFRMSMYEQTRAIQGPNGTERIKVLKQAFNTIINSALSPHFKNLLCIFNYYSLGKVLNFMKSKGQKGEKTYKYYHSSLAHENQVIED